MKTGSSSTSCLLNSIVDDLLTHHMASRCDPNGVHARPNTHDTHFTSNVFTTFSRISGSWLFSSASEYPPHSIFGGAFSSSFGGILWRRISMGGTSSTFPGLCCKHHCIYLLHYDQLGLVWRPCLRVASWLTGVSNDQALTRYGGLMDILNRQCEDVATRRRTMAYITIVLNMLISINAKVNLLNGRSSFGCDVVVCARS